MRDPLTRPAIANTARDILVAEGLHAVSLRRVAARLGVTAPALYAHVLDKRDLLQGIAEQEVEHIAASLESITATDPVDRVRRQCQAYMDYAIKNPDLFRAMFLYCPELTAEPRGARPPLSSRLLELLGEPVREAQENGWFGDEVDADLITLTVWTAVHGAAIFVLSGPSLDIDLKARLADSVISAILTGVRRPVALFA